MCSHKLAAGLWKLLPRVGPQSSIQFASFQQPNVDRKALVQEQPSLLIPLQELLTGAVLHGLQIHPKVVPRLWQRLPEGVLSLESSSWEEEQSR